MEVGMRQRSTDENADTTDVIDRLYMSTPTLALVTRSSDSESDGNEGFGYCPFCNSISVWGVCPNGCGIEVTLPIVRYADSFRKDASAARSANITRAPASPRKEASTSVTAGNSNARIRDVCSNSATANAKNSITSPPQGIRIPNRIN